MYVTYIVLQGKKEMLLICLYIDNWPKVQLFFILLNDYFQKKKYIKYRNFCKIMFNVASKSMLLVKQ